ncbi:Janus/Ocnus family-domain-containing protein [Pavlovales sp. CCMP2436]|nr:Janus/Ocnus family-domain-containing protein [Pavlovales sp. CCMP2436]
MSDGHTTNALDQDRAAALRAAGQQGSGQGSADALDAFPAVSVANGLYKYVLINAVVPKSGERKVLLRSGPGNYHVDVAGPTVNALIAAGLASDIPGGGRINRDDDTKDISIFGFSYGFGKGDHALAAEMCTAQFSGYKVSVSDGGY